MTPTALTYLGDLSCPQISMASKFLGLIEAREDASHSAVTSALTVLREQSRGLRASRGFWC